MTTPKNVILFSNGSVVCFDSAGSQIGELQKGWLEIWLEWIESRGGDPTKMEIETIVNGRNVRLEPAKSEYGWSTKIIG